MQRRLRVAVVGIGNPLMRDDSIEIIGIENGRLRIGNGENRFVTGDEYYVTELNFTNFGGSRNNIGYNIKMNLSPDRIGPARSYEEGIRSAVNLRH